MFARLWRGLLLVTLCGALASCTGGPSFSELFDTSAAAEGTGIQGAGLVRAVVILARHQATSRQREIAQQNAERAIAQLERQIAADHPKATGRKKSTPPKKKSTASQSTKHPAGTKKEPSEQKIAAVEEPEPEPEPQPEPAKPKKKLPARIAVRTVMDEKTAPGAEAAVMIYDVQARRIVGNEVYDIEDEPAPGETVKFDSSVVRYVGATTY
jgi:hypothetical protein